MTIGQWLRELGLDRYEEVFLDNAIDAELLPQLTDEHLTKLGIPMGHRIRLLEAIAELPPRVSRSKPASAGVRRDPSAPARLDGDQDPQDRRIAPPPGQRQRPEAERRQLTVMFVDLVGSTELSTDLDPEDMREVVRSYQNAIAGEIARFEGHVAKFLGDGILAYFGWPLAHENEAERAVRTGLAVVEATARLKTKANRPLAARVGIASGLVVVGDLIGSEEAREQSVVGETPNLAARLQQLAEPGTVVIGQTTHQMLGSLFDMADLGTHSLKGFRTLVRAWRVVGESKSEGRFEALHGAAMVPLVGRDHESGLLLERWSWAKAGEGQVILLSGEPGIGKSRLVENLRQPLQADRPTRMRFQCSPFYTNSALHPVIEHLGRAASIDQGDDPSLKLDKLEELISQAIGPPRKATPLLASLMSIPTGSRYLPIDLSPQRQKEETLAALAAQATGLAKKGPVLIVWEDVHWIDPTSLELLDQLVEKIRVLPVLVVITFRPEFKAAWIGLPHVTVLALNRLGRSQVATLVRYVAGEKSLSSDVLDEIVAKTDGVPLFAEELTKAVLDSAPSQQKRDPRGESGLQIPNTLHDSLMTRLDHLGVAKEIAQIGAAIGREFPYELISAIGALSESVTRDALDELVRSELIIVRGKPPRASYTFKHALVQDAAYQSLLRSKREALHARIAEILETRFTERTEASPELLAHHLTQSAQPELAIPYWRSAGRRALERSANKEAIGHMTKGLELLKALPEGRERDKQELDLRGFLAAALFAVKGYATPEVGQTVSRSRELIRRLGDTDDLIPSWHSWLYNTTRADHRIATEVTNDIYVRSRRNSDADSLLVGDIATAINLLFVGQPLAAMPHFDQAIVACEGRDRPGRERRFGVDIAAAAYAFRAWSSWLMGFPDRALVDGDRLLRLISIGDDRYSYSRGLYWSAVFHHFRGEWPIVAQRADLAIRLSEEHGLAMNVPLARILRSAASIALDSSAAAMQIREGIQQYLGTGARMHVAHHQSLLAMALQAHGAVDEALQVIRGATALVQETGERYWEAEIARLEGDLHLASADAGKAEAESCYLRGLEVARKQEARSLELRAATSLARLWAEAGDRQRALDLLSPIYGWFVEGHDTADLRSAKALCEQLR